VRVATTTTDPGGQPVVPTTVVPILPPTGPNDSNGTMAVVALVLSAVGGSLLALRRRPA
jgi:LPXTG-motif cell wall-anchored protein